MRIYIAQKEGITTAHTSLKQLGNMLGFNSLTANNKFSSDKNSTILLKGYTITKTILHKNTANKSNNNMIETLTRITKLPSQDKPGAKKQSKLLDTQSIADMVLRNNAKNKRKG